MLRALLSALHVFRVVSPNHVLSLSTITDPFKGVGTRLDEGLVKKALSNMGFTPLKPKFRNFSVSYKAGVNASQAFLSSPFDLVALMSNLKLYTDHLRLAYSFKFYRYITFFCVSSIFCLPLYLFKVWIPIYYGRLHFIKELKGKTRVVGITNQ
jgi:hypothetical protein